MVRYEAMHLPLASNSGGGVHTQLFRLQMMSAPCNASRRGTSGNHTSQQIIRPIRPIGVSNTGKPRSPGLNQSFSWFHRCALR
ncbi:hypothetical protein D3C77_628100 [compost metagenome]